MLQAVDLLKVEDLYLTEVKRATALPWFSEWGRPYMLVAEKSVSNVKAMYVFIKF